MNAEARLLAAVRDLIDEVVADRVAELRDDGDGRGLLDLDAAAAYSGLSRRLLEGAVSRDELRACSTGAAVSPGRNGSTNG